MQMKICSALALAISAASLPLAHAADAASAPANGFLEESQLTLLSRNVALYRNLKNNSNAADNGGVNSSQNYVNEWAQAEMLTFTSGFTQGTVGFGVDAFANGAVRLTGGAGTGGSNVLPGDNSNCDALTGTCQGQDAYGLAGGAEVAVEQEHDVVGKLAFRNGGEAASADGLADDRERGILARSVELLGDGEDLFLGDCHSGFLRVSCSK